MALSVEGYLEIDKVLRWKVQLPVENKVRQSPPFSLVGEEWCLRFSLKGTSKGTAPSDEFDFYTGKYVNKTVYHVITLHRVIDGQVAIATAASGELPPKEKFSLKTFLVQLAEGRTEEKNVTHTPVQTNTTRIWYAGDHNDDIFKTFPSLYNCFEVTVVCKFYGRPLSAFQLDVGSDRSTTLRTVPTDLECLSRDLRLLLDGGQLQDVRLECGDQTFPAHRSVLAARSPVFAAMFRTRMSENETGAVRIEDADPETFRRFLRYLYSGEMADGSGDAVASLLALADMYGVDSLKSACARWIVGGLTEGNCLECLAVGDRYRSEALKEEAIACACAHPDVMLSEEWAEFSKKNPTLALEVHQSFVRLKTRAQSS